MYKKTLFASALVLLMALVSVSCSDSPDSLSSGKAKKVLNKEIERIHSDQNYTAIQTGYFECNDEGVRYKYRQLAANEMITYKCDIVKKAETVRKTRKVKRNYYYYSYYDTESYYVKEDVNTYFVTIELTEKGKKYVVDSLPESDPTEDDKDVLLVNKKLVEEFDSTMFPEFKVSPVEFPEDRKVDVEVAPETAEVEAAEFEVPDEMQPEDYDVDGVEISEYEKAKSRENVTLVTVRAYDINVVKVRNITVSNEDVATARGEAVIEMKDVTPFGRILSGVMEKERHTLGVDYVFYQDKGWTLKTDVDN